MSCPYAYSDGAYVLGALCPSERSAFESHLPGCEECTAAVARLAPMAGLLGRADPATLAGAEDRGERLPQLITAVSGHRRRQARRRRWRLAAAVAASALLAVLGTVVTAGALDRPPPSEQMAPVAASAPVTGWVGLTQTDAGTEVWLRCSYPAAGHDEPYGDEPRVFRLVAIAADGSSEQVGSWLAGLDDTVTVTGVTRFTVDELARVELRDADGDPLLAHDV